MNELLKKVSEFLANGPSSPGWRTQNFFCTWVSLSDCSASYSATLFKTKTRKFFFVV
jgi:hypothetical protein